MAPILPSYYSPITAQQRLAEVRARALLLSYLSPCQRWMLENVGWFYVQSPHPGRIPAGHLYALYHPRKVILLTESGVPTFARNVWLEDEFSGDVFPPSDSILAQYLVIRAAPMLLIGCHSGVIHEKLPGLMDGRYLQQFLRGEDCPQVKRSGVLKGKFRSTFRFGTLKQGGR